MSLHRDRGSMPLYAQISQEIEDRILSGEYATGTIIPSEKQLQEIHGKYVR